MSRKQPESLTAGEAKKQVSQRLRFSRWFASGMLAVGVGSGLLIADSPPEKARPIDGAAFATIFAASGAAVAERIRAKNQSERTILDFNASRGQDSTSTDPLLGSHVTVVSVDEYGLSEERRWDWRTIGSLDNLGAFVNSAPPFLGGIGSVMAARVTLSGLEIQDNTELGRIGFAFLGCAVLGLVANELLLDGAERSYLQRIDNIDGGLSFST